MSTTPEFERDGQDDQPMETLDVYHDATTPTASVDEFLEGNNLGLGNYESDSELYQQLERFSDGMYAAAAFQETLLKRAVGETKRKLAREGKTFWDDREMDAVSLDGWHDLDDDERAEKSKREFLERRGEEIWKRMGEEERLDALEITTGITRNWSPPQLRQLVANHELTRSRDARLMDNLFGRIEKLVTKSEDSDSGGLLGGGS